MSTALVTAIAIAMLGLSFACTTSKNVKTAQYQQKPSQNGPCDLAHIRQQVTAAAPKLTACFNEALKKRPSIQGTMLLRWFIIEDGSVRTSSTKFLKTDIAEPEFQACVVETINRLKFNRPIGGLCCIIFPFSFTPES